MARNVRIQCPGVIYHVMNRGDRRQAIFGDDEDRQRLLQPQELALGPRRSMPPGNMTISLTGTFMEGRVLELGLKRGRKELAEEWKAIRRGWYVGGMELKGECWRWWSSRCVRGEAAPISERLGMGDESRVTQPIGRLERKGQPKLERLNRRLEQAYENHNGEVEV